MGVYPTCLSSYIDLPDFFCPIAFEAFKETKGKLTIMNPLCDRCDKIVYPTEKVNCLDKVSDVYILIQ